jgi:hypothetical protein
MLDETSMIVMRFKLAILGRLQVMKKLKACAVRMRIFAPAGRET